MARRSAAVTVLSLSTLALLAAGGCGSLRWNPSPGVDTLYQRPDDIDNTLAVVWDTNWRMFNQDLGRVLLFDRPSMLTLEPMPH